MVVSGAPDILMYLYEHVTVWEAWPYARCANAELLAAVSANEQAFQHGVTMDAVLKTII